MQSTIPVAYVLLAIAAIAIIVFYIVWARRSDPANGSRDSIPDQGSRAPNITDRPED